MTNKKSSLPRKSSTRLEASTARARQALAELNILEEKRKEAYRQQRAELERTAAIEEARLRNMQREQRRIMQAQFASILGRLVLGSLEHNGFEGEVLNGADVEGSLPPEVFSELRTYIAIRQRENAAKVKPAENTRTGSTPDSADSDGGV